jgi:soluble lytic murein transglycosylase-like protein
MKRTMMLGLAALFVTIFATVSQAELRCAKPQTKACAVANITSNVIGLKNRKKVATYKKTRNVKLARSTQRALPAARQRVVALIKQMAPRYGVPTWFALRIAKVESGYNPNARGRAGEYGVFQMKCATARIIGYRGNCRGLLNASTNVQVGLKHLSLAVRSSRGNLKLAASKHNGGLGRKRLVRAYVNRVF